MIKVLITNFHPHGGGGHVPYIDALTQINQDNDFVIGVATPKRSRLYSYLNELGYPHLYACDFPAKIQKEPLSILKNLGKFRKITQDFQPDIVHTNGSADLFIALLARLNQQGYRLVRTHHAIKKITDNFYHRRLYQQKVSSNIYVSESSRQLSAKNALAINNYTVIENGVDTRRFSPATKNTALAQQLGINDGVFCFGSCAGTGSYKRVDVMIRAAATLPASTPPFKILALGDTKSGQALAKLAKELGVGQFEYCGFHKNTPDYISLFDVGFILSDSIETISFAAREMMAMGKPLLSSSFSGLKENVLDGKNGYLVAPDDIQQTAEAMLKFLHMDKVQLAEFSQNAQAYALTKFDINTQINKHKSLYKNIVNINS